MADPWVNAAAEELVQNAERELTALVGVSSPSGDVAGAEKALAVCSAFLPVEAELERLPCSSEGHADDMLARMTGTGARRLLLLGHVDTVHAHADHRPLEREGERLIGSGAVDMKGGVVLALGVMRALAEERWRFAEVDLLLVVDEEWRQGDLVHAERFKDFDACLCFEAGERGRDGEEGVVVRRKAAGTLHITANGRSSHAGSDPDGGRNALLALAEVARMMAAHHDPDGIWHLTAVPTVLHAGRAFNVVPDEGELYCDLRADSLDAFTKVLASVPSQLQGVQTRGHFVRRWPSMDSEVATHPLLRTASYHLGAPIVPRERGGASDASHMAPLIPLTVDGLGPRGGGAHTVEEYVLADSLRPRAALALALVVAALTVE